MTEKDKAPVGSTQEAAPLKTEADYLAQFYRSPYRNRHYPEDVPLSAAPSPPSSTPQTETAFDDLLAINEQSSKAFFEMRRVLLMALQLAYSGNHDGTNEACPTCHVVKEARQIGIVFDAETGEPLG